MSSRRSVGLRPARSVYLLRLRASPGQSHRPIARPVALRRSSGTLTRITKECRGFKGHSRAGEARFVTATLAGPLTRHPFAYRGLPSPRGRATLLLSRDHAAFAVVYLSPTACGSRCENICIVHARGGVRHGQLGAGSARSRRSDRCGCRGRWLRQSRSQVAVVSRTRRRD
jgi:hypothetical protein